jgi:hypothetical protein
MLGKSMITETPTDFVVTSYAQNAHIIRAMSTLNTDPIRNTDGLTVEGLCRVIYRAHNEKLNKRQKSLLIREVQDLVALRLVPKKPNGEWIGSAVLLANTLGVQPDELWPGILATTIPDKRSGISEMRISENAVWFVM